jgi:hypothetical protein
MRVSILMQLSACFSGAVSGFGKERCCLNVRRRVVRARMRVSTLARELSLARRTSRREKRLKTSSVDSGSSQNYNGLTQLRGLQVFSDVLLSSMGLKLV